MFKIQQSRFGRVALQVVALAIIFSLAAPVMRAQTADCDATSFNGAFGYKLAGSVYDNQGYIYVLGAVGRLVSDGAGTINGTHTYSFDGNIVKQQYSGTYTVNADCTGSMTMNPTDGSSVHYDFVILNNGQQVDVVQTDVAYIVTGEMKQQKPVQTQTTPPVEQQPMRSR